MSININENIISVLEYETYMLISLKYLLSQNLETVDAINRALINALVESMLIHIRILSDIFLSRVKTYSDEINLSKIIDDKRISPSLKQLIEKLDKAYGNSKNEGSPCWTINKMFAHASDLRSSSYDYKQIVNQLYPNLVRIIEEINKILQNPKIKSNLEFAYSIK
jgi:hypothetical protein